MFTKSIKFFLPVFALAIFLFSCGTRNLDRLSNKKYLEKNYVELKELLPEAQVTILNDTIKVLFPNNLLFKTAESTLSENVDPLMNRFSACLNKYKKTSIMIAGHTDNVGNIESNKKLSSDRAESAKTKLMEMSVDPNRMFTWGHGDTHPLVSNDSEENRALNRRVEFIILIGKD